MPETLKQYIAELWHEPSMSPLSSKPARDISNKAHAALPGLMAERGMRMVAGYHLDPEHRAFLVFEAKCVEDVRDVLYEAGYMHYCNGRIFPSTPLKEMHKWAIQMPTMSE